MNYYDWRETRMKKFLAVLLCVCMTASLCVVGASAEAAALPEAVNGVITLTENVDLATACVISSNTTINLNGYNITVKNDTAGDGVFKVTAGTLTINGEGTIDGVGNNTWDMALWAAGGNIVINGGTYTNVGAGSDDHYDLIYASVSTSTITINGGTFTAQTPKWTLNLKDNCGANIVIKGGTFANYDPSKAETEPGGATNFVAAGYKVAADGDNYVVSDGLPAPVNGVIDLTEDVDLPTAHRIRTDTILNLNGYSITVKNDTEGDGVFKVIAGTLTINGEGTVDGVGNNAWNMALWAAGGNIVINGGHYTNLGANGGSDQTHYDLIYVSNAASTVTINGGTFAAQTPKWTLNLKDNCGATIAVNGGLFQGYDPSSSETEPGGVTNFVSAGYKSTGGSWTVGGSAYNYKVSAVPSVKIQSVSASGIITAINEPDTENEVAAALNGSTIVVSGKLPAADTQVEVNYINTDGTHGTVTFDRDDATGAFVQPAPFKVGSTTYSIDISRLTDLPADVTTGEPAVQPVPSPTGATNPEAAQDAADAINARPLLRIRAERP
jgi:hypothetical protein